MVNNKILRIILIILSAFLLWHISFAQQNNPDFVIAIEAFQNEDFEKAVSFFEKLESTSEEIDNDSKSILSFFKGTCYYRIGNLNKALSSFEKIQNLSPSNRKILLEIKPTLLSICSEIGNKQVAQSYLDEMLDLFYNKEQLLYGLYSNYAVALNTYYLENEQYDKALDIARKGLSVIDFENINEQLRQIQKCTLYHSSGKSNLKLKKYDQACIDFKNALLNSTHIDTLYKAELLYNIGICFDYVNMPDSSLYYYSEAEKIYVKKDSPITKNRIDNAMSLGVNLIHTGDYLNALQYLNIAADGYEKLEDKGYLLYTYSYIYVCLKEIGNRAQISKYSDYIKQFIKEVRIDDDRIAHICYSTYASILALEGNINQAISIMNDIIDAEMHNRNTPAFSLSVSFYRQGCLMLDNCDFQNAEKYIQKSLDLIQPIKDKYRKQYIEAVVCYAEILKMTNGLGKAIAWMENLQPIAQKLPENSIIFSYYYSYLSSLYAEIGNYDKYLTYSLLDCQATMNYMGENSYNYASSLINLYEAYKLNHQNEQAENCLKKASEITKKLFGEDSKEYYKIIHKKSISYTFEPSKNGNKVFKKCLTLSYRLFGPNSKEYATDLCWYGMFKLYTSKDKSGLALMHNGIDILLNIKDEANSLFFLSQLSVWSHYFKEYDIAYNTSKKYYITTKQYVSSNFPYLVDWQRESLWNGLHENLQIIIPMAVETNSPEFLKLAYNSLLVGKGLLLQSSNLISNVIIKNEDLDLNEIHSQINTDKNRLLNVIEYEKIDSINHNIFRLQRQELNKLSLQEDFNKIFNYDWTDIRNKLKDEDVAIEFVSYPTQDCNSYIALVVNSQSTTPMCIPLFNDKEIKKYSNDIDTKYDYSSFDLYKLIWSKLETNVLKNIRNIYFSADGIIHNIAIEGLKDNNGKSAAEKWQINRLSSTREILNESIKTKYKNAILYGGLQFSDIKKETKNEVDEIKKILDQYNVTAQTLSDSVGTEKSFKALSDSEFNLLHMATHGHFWTNESENKYKNVKFKCLIDQFTPKESALLRSGLLLSGANHALKGLYIDNNIEDGVLTAHEISTMKFKDLDLVVLSACETGLGEVTPDGVFGLQRGFKLAGAKSILMSLWEVDNDATKMLMVEFYKNFLKGDSKTTSLKKAQEYVKSQPGYEDPEFWAGFILLDGLD